MSLERLEQLFRLIGWTAHDAVAYHHVLQAGEIDIRTLAREAVLDGVTVTRTVEKLKAHFLIACDVVRRRDVIFAIDPEVAWKALANQAAWSLATDLQTFAIEANEPTLSTALTVKGCAQEIQRHMLEIGNVANKSYQSCSHILDHQWRQTLSPEDTASMLIHALHEAKHHIHAVSYGPRLPQVAQIWQTLIRRMSAGVTYERIVDLREIVEHGLFIVERDVFDAGVRLSLLEDAALQHSFYIIDGRFLVVLNKTGPTDASIIGRFTRQGETVRRYRKRFTSYKANAVPALYVLQECRRFAADMLNSAALAGFSGEEMEWLECLVNWGVFCHAPAPTQTVREQALAHKITTVARNGKTVINYRLSMPQLRATWLQLTTEQQKMYEYRDNQRNNVEGHHNEIKAT